MATKHIHEIIARMKGFGKATKESKKLKQSLGGLRESVIGLGAAYLGAAGLTAAVKGSILAYAEQERAEKKLAGALGKSTDALVAQAAAMQKVTIFGDEAIITQQAFLASIGMSEQQIRKILPVAADLASATGMTLESAVRNTAKTFSGLAGELGELVPQLRDLTAEEMKAGKAVEVMADLFKNQAAVEAQTVSGQIAQLTNNLGDFAENVGEWLSSSGALGGLVQWSRDLGDGIAWITGNMNGVTAATDKYSKNIEILNLRKKVAGEMVDLFTDKLQNEDEIRESVIRSGKTEAEINERLISSVMEYSQRIISLNEQIEKEHQNKELANEWSEKSIKVREKESEIISETLVPKYIGMTQAFEKAIPPQEKLVKMTEAEIGALMFKEAKLTDLNNLGQMALKSNLLNAKDAWKLTLTMALADAAAAIIKAGKVGGPIGALTMAATNAPQIAAIYANQPAQTGFEGVVDEPTQFTVGEGGAAEYVSVTPMEGVNNAGGGSGININISGNVMSQQFVEEELSERIAEAVRKGISFA
tara:strand:- start:1232 stop:2833 length:1602 start_codon:yes stop_codon:yes gene_type:complete